MTAEIIMREELIVALEIHEVPVPKLRARASVRRSRDGRMFASMHTPNATAVAEWQIREALSQALHQQNGSWSPLTKDAVRLDVTAYLPVPKSMPKKHWGIALPTGKPDTDNLLKILGDAANNVLFRDDSQAVDESCHKRYAWTGVPRWLITAHRVWMEEGLNVLPI